MTRRRKTRRNILTVMLVTLVILGIIANAGHIIGWLIGTLALAVLAYQAGKTHTDLKQGSPYWEAYWRKYYGELYKRATKTGVNARYGKRDMPADVIEMDIRSAYPDMPIPDVSAPASTRRKLINQRFSGIRPLTRRDEE